MRAPPSVRPAVLAPARVDRPSLGIGLMLAAYLCFTGIDASARWLTREAGLPPLEVAFVRYAVHLAIVLALFWPAEGARLWRTRALSLEIWRGAALLGSTIFNFTAVKYLPLSLTSSIFFTIPILVCALSVPLLGERVGARRWTAVGVGLIGVLLVTRPWSAELHWAVGMSVGAAICAALYAIATRRLAGVEPTNTQQFYAALVATVGLAPVAFLDWSWPVRPVDWAVFVAIGGFGWLGHQFITIAHRYAPASTLSPFVYVLLIYMTLADLAIFGVAPDPWIFPGAAVVVASGVYIWLRERRLGGATTGR